MASYLKDTEKALDPLNKAIESDAYNYMNANAQGQEYVSAIRTALRHGLTPEEIKLHAVAELGPDRLSLALRCGQVARYIYRTEFDDGGFAPESAEEVAKEMKTPNRLYRTK